MHCYLAYGLHIASEIPLPEFQVGGRGGDVEVRLGPKQSEPGDEWSAITNVGFSWPRRGVGVYNHPTAGRFALEQGRKVTLYPEPEIDWRMAQLCLAGPVLAGVLYQREATVLHAGSVLVDGQVAAFVGACGQGKSTLTAAMHAAGHPIVTDDLVAVPYGKREIYPGYPQIKIAPETAQVLGLDPRQIRPLHPASPKSVYRSTEVFPRVELPLGAIFSLSQGEALNLRRLSPREALVQLIAHSYRFDQAQGGLDTAAYFRALGDLIERVPVYELQRPRSLELLPATVTLIRRQLELSLPVAVAEHPAATQFAVAC